MCLLFHTRILALISAGSCWLLHNLTTGHRKEQVSVKVWFLASMLSGAPTSVVQLLYVYCMRTAYWLGGSVLMPFEIGCEKTRSGWWAVWFRMLTDFIRAAWGWNSKVLGPKPHIALGFFPHSAPLFPGTSLFLYPFKLSFSETPAPHFCPWPSTLSFLPPSWSFILSWCISVKYLDYYAVALLIECQEC